MIRDAGGTIKHTYTLIDGIAAEVPAKAIPGLRHNPRVVSVDLDGTVSAVEPMVQAQATGDYEYDNAWGVVHIGTKAVHDAGIRAPGVKVAIIDSGIDYIHDQPAANEPPVVDPEFLGNYKGGFDFLDPLDTQGNGPLDDNGHGTHVAGILAAEKNGYLVVGVAPQVDLYALKILDAAGNGLESDLVLALQWAVAHDIDVVNMSIGTQVENLALGTAVANAAAQGLLMVAASGNTVTLQEIFYGCPVAYPARYPQVLSTTFTNPNDALTGYSCTGDRGRLRLAGRQHLLARAGGLVHAVLAQRLLRAERDVDGVAAPRRDRRAAARRRHRGHRRRRAVRRRPDAAVRRPRTWRTASRRSSATRRSRPAIRATRSTSAAGSSTPRRRSSASCRPRRPATSRRSRTTTPRPSARTGRPTSPSSPTTPTRTTTRGP